jgi:hypothetical protein
VGGCRGGNLTNVQCKAIQNCHTDPPVQWTYANKNEKKERNPKKSSTFNDYILAKEGFHWHSVSFMNLV